MPKEIVAGASIPNDRDPFHVKVGWTASQHVQLGVETDQGHSLFWVLLGATVTADHQTKDSEAEERERSRRRLAELGARVREAVEQIPHQASVTDPGDLITDARVGEAVLNTMDDMTILEYTGVWANLSREGCNRLIQIVRKARDSAYGSDE